MNFRVLCNVSAVLFFALSLTLLVVPQLVYWLFSVPGNDLGDFLARRAGVLFVGLAMLCFAARGMQSLEVQRLLSVSIGLSMGSMAALGVLEYARGFAGAGILVAVVVEAMLAFAFWRVWRNASQFG